MCVRIVVLGPVLGLDAVEQRARAGEDSESNSLLRIQMPSLRRSFERLILRKMAPCL